MYRAGMPIASVLAPCVRLGFRGQVERRQRLGFMALDDDVFPVYPLIIYTPLMGRHAGSLLGF